MAKKSKSFRNITTVLLALLLLGITVAPGAQQYPWNPRQTDSKFETKQINSPLKIKPLFIFA